jgi:hypothetical protein
MSSTSASERQWQTTAIEEMHREERASDPSPPVAEIAETFEMHLCLITATVARFWGLEINQDTPDFGAFESLLLLNNAHVNLARVIWFNDLLSRPWAPYRN